jgi:two-component system chemotaxis response regulator CheB
MPYALVVIGASRGGFEALKVLLGGLPPTFPPPVAIAQHRASDAETDFSAMLQRYCPLTVREPEDKEAILPGHVYLAPMGYHLLVEPGAFALSTDAPVLFARPAIDVLFESAADAYGEGTIGVVLTGASADGARGLARIKSRGGYAIVQDPAGAHSPVMPKAAIAATSVDRVLPVGAIAPSLVQLCVPPP